MTDTPTSDAPEAPEVLPCGMTAKQKEQWESTCSMMAWTCPGFQHLWYKLLDNNNGDYTAVMTKSVPTAATDARNIMINPDNFFQFSLAERTFIMAHEIVHNVYQDVPFLHRCIGAGKVPMNDGASLPFRDDIMQKAMDLRINALLIKSKIGKPPTKDGKPFGHYDDKMTGEESVLDVYKKVYEEDVDPNQPEGDEPGPGGNPGGFDNVMKPGASTGQTPQQAQQNPQQWQVELAAAQIIEANRSQGKMQAALKRMFEKLLEPEVDWRNHIASIINRMTGSGGWNWKQPDEYWAPHEFFSPKRSGKGAGWIVIWGDTSGSRGDTDIASNIAELKGIIEDVNPKRLTVIWCDADILDDPDSVVELDDASDLTTLKPVGGGGTDVQPVYDWMKKQMGGEPDLFIGFTDGYVTFPKAPGCPVIWASSTDDVVYPYGQVVRVNKNPKRA